MRACSEDKAAAQLMGIDVNRTISMTFAIGSALAAIAGVLFLSTYTSLTPTTGSMPGIKAFTAAVFGGIGSIHRHRVRCADHRPAGEARRPAGQDRP